MCARGLPTGIFFLKLTWIEWITCVSRNPFVEKMTRSCRVCLSGKEIKRLKPKRAASFFSRQPSAVPAYSAVQVAESLEQGWAQSSAMFCSQDQTWKNFTPSSDKRLDASSNHLMTIYQKKNLRTNCTRQYLTFDVLYIGRYNNVKSNWVR